MDETRREKRNARRRAQLRGRVARGSRLAGYTVGADCTCGARLSMCCRPARAAYMRAYSRSRPDYFREKTRRRKHRLRRSGAPKSVARRRRRLVAYLLEFQGGRCAYCRVPLEVGPISTVDHVVPIAAGGSHDVGNLVAACFACNSAKSDRDVAEFLASLAA